MKCASGSFLNSICVRQNLSKGCVGGAFHTVACPESADFCSLRSLRWGWGKWEEIVHLLEILPYLPSFWPISSKQ